MSELRERSTDISPRLRRVGLVVHPTRDLERPLSAVRTWAQDHEVDLVQIPFAPGQRAVAPVGEVAGCDVVVALGGDGTSLAAIRCAAPAGKPVLGVACGSLGALTAVPASEVQAALGDVMAGHWHARSLPALHVEVGAGPELVAYNDLAVVRRGDGQLRIAISVDGTLYIRLAGDGVVASTPAGSGAYTLAAGGPLLTLDLPAYVITPLPTHGGSTPPLVLRAEAVLELTVEHGHGGGQLELDGRRALDQPTSLRITMEPAAATVVTLPGQEAYLTGLRRRGVLMDSPRIIADDRRRGCDAGVSG